MSISTILNIATSGVLAQQTAIAATAENIANITTPDFARRDVQFQADAIPGQFSGVSVTVARDSANSFLQSAVFSAASDSAGLGAVADALTRISESLGTSDDAISFADRASDAAAALATLSASPNSAGAQAVAIGALDGVFSAFQQTQGAISTESDRAVTGLGFDVEQANSLLTEIFTLNTQIAAGGGDSNGPIDAVSARLSELAGLLNISVARDDIGRATISTGDGRILVNATGFAALDVSGGVQPRITISGLSTNPVVNPESDSDATSEITSGSIGSALTLLNTELPALASLIESTQQNFVTSLNAAAGNSTAIPLRSSLVASQSISDGAIAALSGETTLAVVNNNGVLASRIDINFDTNTISVDGVASVAFPADVNGLVTALNVALGNNGSAILENGVLSIQTAQTGSGLAFTNDSAGIAAAFGFNPLISNQNGQFQVAAEIRDNFALFPVGTLSLEGGSVAGEQVLELSNEGVTALFAAASQQANALASTLGEIGAAANTASARAAGAEAFSEDVNARLLEESGVNLEEELSNLILFQRSFNANARILAVADELYESVLALI